jgi:hypothetical protein
MNSERVTGENMSGVVSEGALLAIRLALAYQVSRAIYVATELGVPDLIGDRSRSSGDLARETRTDPDMMRRLLRALAAFAILDDLGNATFRLTSTGHCLRCDWPSSVRPLVLFYGSEHSHRMFASLSECLKSGKNAFEIQFGEASSFNYLVDHSDLANIYNDGMSAISSVTGPAIASTYGFAGFRHVVDVGGGHGKVLASILRANRHLRGTLFDLPRVVQGASQLLLREGVADRCDSVGGDMFEAVPSGADLYLLSHVVHNWNDTRAGQILQACRRAMSKGSKLLILDRVLPDRISTEAKVQGNVLLDLTMMVRTAGGRERTADEFQSLLVSNGLRLKRVVSMEIAESLIEAEPN